MTAPRRRIVIIIMVLSVALATIILRPLSDAGGFHVPSMSETAGARRMFASALASGFEQSLTGTSQRYGLETKPVSESRWRGMMLSEPDKSCDGRGAYLLRDDADALPVALMAPHRGADRWTGNITADLFSDYPFAAAAWNSAPRRIKRGCRAGGDITRTKTHFFTAFSLAFAERFPDGRVIQIHGFDKRLRTSNAARQSDIIVSNGTETPSESLLDLADCLSRNLPLHTVSVFPLDVRELGALENRQGQALRSGGFAGFTHIEMSAELRRAMAEDPQLRDSFARCLSVGTK